MKRSYGKRAAAAVGVVILAGASFAGGRLYPEKPAAVGYRSPVLVPVDRPFGENLTDMSIWTCATLRSEQEGALANGEGALAAGNLYQQRLEETRLNTDTLGRGGIGLDTLRSCADKSAIGLYAADLDGDRLPELVELRDGLNVLVHWNAGGGRFRTRGVEALDALTRQGRAGGEARTTLTVVDADRNGWPDIVILPTPGRQRLEIVLNEGGVLRAQTVSVDVAEYPGSPDSPAVEDLDGDGGADIIVPVRTSYAATGEIRPVRVFMSRPAPTYFEETTGDLIPGYSVEEPISPFDTERATKQRRQYQPFLPIVADFDRDGDRDVFVSGDFGGSHLYENRDGVLVDITGPENVIVSQAGMGAIAWDFNDDGLLDIFATEITHDHLCGHARTRCPDTHNGNTLFLNKGGMRFEESVAEYGLSDTGFGWGFSSTDLNLDGYPDLLVGTGELASSRIDPNWFATFHKPYLLLGGTAGFRDDSGSLYRVLRMPGTTVAVLSADFDGDMRPDIVIKGRESSSPHLLMNRSEGPAPAMLEIRGDGITNPTGGESTEVTVEIPGRPTQRFTWPGRGTNYRTGSSFIPFPISLGDSDTADVSVRYPDGTVRTGELRSGLILTITDR